MRAQRAAEVAQRRRCEHCRTAHLKRLPAGTLAPEAALAPLLLELLALLELELELELLLLPPLTWLRAQAALWSACSHALLQSGPAWPRD